MHQRLNPAFIELLVERSRKLRDDPSSMSDLNCPGTTLAEEASRVVMAKLPRLLSSMIIQGRTEGELVSLEPENEAPANTKNLAHFPTAKEISDELAALGVRHEVRFESASQTPKCSIIIYNPDKV